MEPSQPKKSNTKIILAAVVIVIVVAVGIAGYLMSTSTTSTSTSTSMMSSSAMATSAMPQTLTVDEASAPTTNDPGAAIDNNGLELAQNTNLPLTFCANAGCTSLLPVLATSWTESPDGLTYTFNLRSGVYYNNRDPFNAYVVWYNVYRDLYINQAADFIFYVYLNTSGVSVGDLNSFNNPANDPTSNSTLLHIMENPANGVTVLNATAVQFHLTNPFVAFLQSIDTSPWVFVDPYTVEQHGGVVANQPNSWMAVNGTTVGDGPYIVQVYVVNQYATMIANPHYWAQNVTDNIILEPAKIPTVTIYYKTQELTRTEDLESGAVQGSIVNFNDMTNVLNACKTCTIPNTGLSGTMEWISVDMLKAPTSNLLVREAIVAAINVTEIQASVYDGYARAVIGPMPSDFPYYNSSIAPPVYNVTLAKALLAEAGYPNGAGFPSINLVFGQGGYAALVAEIVKQDLSAIGINVQTQALTIDELIETQAIAGNATNAPYLAVAPSWTYYPDFSAYEFLIDSSLGVFGNFYNATVHNLILQSNTQLNPTLRAQEISDVTSLSQQAAGNIWIGQDIDMYDTGGGIGPTIWNNCVSGLWYNTAFNGVDFNSVYFSCTP